MIVGVPKETKRDEYRVGLLPVGAEELTRAGHRVLVEAGAGLGSGLADQDYVSSGARTGRQPQRALRPGRHDHQGQGAAARRNRPAAARPDRLHLLPPGRRPAADRSRCWHSGCIAVAYETLRDEHGRLPLLTPMSEVAGRMSIQEGAKYLERPQMGRGILLAGVPGVEPAHITILGGGVVGANAARIAAGFRANIGLLDINMDRLRYLDDIMPPNVTVLFSDRHTIREQLRRADLVIGAVLVPGAKAPCLVEREDLKLMKPGSVIIDVAVDQGGCVGDHPAHHAQQSDLRRRRRAALLRGEHARRGGPHQHLRPVQRDVALGLADRQPRPAGGGRGLAAGGRGRSTSTKAKSPIAPWPKRSECRTIRGLRSKEVSG